MPAKVLFTDGEGPLVFKDLAQDLMERAGLADFFELLSLYDDYLAEVGTEGYQAGDTLALVVPHFLHHGLTDSDVVEESKDAKVCLGVEEYIKGLQNDEWEIRVISTAYRPMWKLIGDYLGIPQEHIACTELNLSELREKYQMPRFNDVVEKMEQEVLPQVLEIKKEIDKGRLALEIFEDPKFASLRDRLDKFYWQELKELGYPTLETVEVCGGRRKIEAAQHFAAELNVSLKDVAYVGDSITDDALHKHLKEEGGLPIAINGNIYALRNARVAVATRDMRDVRPVLDAWSQGGMEEVEEFVKTWGRPTVRIRKEGEPIFKDEGVYYHLIPKEGPGRNVIALHGIFRSAVRGAAAKLG